MIKTFLSRATIFVVASLFLFMTSCVQKEYEISEETMNLEVTVFQEGISLPLGSTKALTIGQLIDQLGDEVKDMFALTDGAYSFGMSDKFDFSDQLDFLSENFSIDAFSTNESVPFNLADVDLSGVNVPENRIPFEQVLADVISPVELKIDPIRPDPMSESTDISRYMPSEDQLRVDMEGYSYDGVVASLKPVELSSYQELLKDQWSTPLPVNDVKTLITRIPALNAFNIDTKTEFAVTEAIKIPLEIHLPDAVKEVKSIDLKDGAKVKISVDLSDNLFFTSGDIIPTLDLDITSIFNLHIQGEEGKFVLNNESENPYFASHTYNIDEIALDYRIGQKANPSDGDFHMENGHLVLYKEVSVTPELSLEYVDLMTSLEKLSTYNEPTDVTMNISIEFIDFVVDNVAVVVEPIVTEISTSVDINISETLPEMVNGVREVTFASGSGMTLNIDVDNIDRIKGLDFAIESIELTFPAGLNVEGTDANNKLNIPIGTLTDEAVVKNIAVYGIEIDPKTQTPGTVSFDGSVQVAAAAKIGVKENSYINTKDLPTEEKDNISLSVSAEATFEVADFEVDFEGYYYEVEESETFEFSVGKEVADLGTVKVVPVAADGSEPVITIDVELPETNLTFGPSEEGLIIDFPDMLSFKELAPGLTLTAGNVLKFTGAIPSHIELPIDYIIAEAKQIEGKEGYWVSDVFTVSGKVGVAAGIVTKTDFDALTAPGAKVSFNAYIPELVPSTVDINSYQAAVPEETISFGERIDLSTLPAELVGVGEILLKDVVLNVSVKAPGINELIKGADIDLAMFITLPDVIMVDEGLVNSEGVLEIKGKLVDEQIQIDPINIYGLRLNKTTEELSDYMSGLEIKYGGNISVENATIDMDALENTELNLNVEVKLATTGTDVIQIAGVTGYVDYQVDPISMEVELGPMLEALNAEGMNTVLDLHRFSLALDIKTNLSIPILADLLIIPYKDDVAMEDNVIKQSLQINMSESTSEPSLIRFWISNYPVGEDPYMPAGYQHISLDFLNLISLSPDKIALALNAGTDPDTLASIVPSEEGYVLEAGYAFNLPLEFGDETKIQFRHVIEGLPGELATILQYASFALAGEVESSLPFGFELSFNFLDSERNVVELAENAGKQVIQPGTATGEPVKTDLNILVGLKKNVDVTDISAIEFVFKANSVAGAPIREDAFIRASLQALIPEGVTLDLGEMKNSEM